MRAPFLYPLPLTLDPALSNGQGSTATAADSQACADAPAQAETAVMKQNSRFVSVAKKVSQLLQADSEREGNADCHGPPQGNL